MHMKRVAVPALLALVALPLASARAYCVRPAPVYVAPAPVYVQPAPVYVQPAPAAADSLAPAPRPASAPAQDSALPPAPVPVQ